MTFATILGLGLGVLVLIALAGAIILPMIYRQVVPTNEVHVVQSKKNTISYGRGRDSGNAYYRWPSWIPVIGITVSEFPESIFSIDLEDYKAYDQDRIPFVVHAIGFFRIVNSDDAAQRVSNFSELRQQLHGVMQGAIRSILAKNHLESILQERASLSEQFTHAVDDQLKEWGVKTVKNIEFMDIKDSTDSKVISNIMAKESSRIDMESRTAIAGNGKLAQTAEIEAKREVELRNQEAIQAVGQRAAETKKQVGISNEKAQQEVQTEAKTTAEKTMAVQQVNEVTSAEIAKKVATVNAEAQRSVQTVQAEAEKTVQVTKAEGERTAVATISLGNLEAARNNAQGIEAVGKAEGEAEKAKLMAPVATQIELAREIGENKGYQEYLVTIRTVEANQEVGVQMAGALKAADIKVIANGGNITGGMHSVVEMLSPQGGTQIGAFVSALKNNPDTAALGEAAGKVIDKFTGTDKK